jgi:hypothetical protein
MKFTISLVKYFNATTAMKSSIEEYAQLHQSKRINENLMMNMNTE